MHVVLSEIDFSMHSDQVAYALATAKVIRVEINEISPFHLMSGALPSNKVRRRRGRGSAWLL